MFKYCTETILLWFKVDVIVTVFVTQKQNILQIGFTFKAFQIQSWSATSPAFASFTFMDDRIYKMACK